jgi:hypothetical protein
MILRSTDKKPGALWLSITLGVLGCAGAFAQNTLPQTDPVKAYSTIGTTPGETLRLNVVSLGGADAVPPPCNVQMGFVNAAGALVKSANATIAPGHAAFLTLTFNEGAAFVSAADSRTRLNFRPVVSTLAPPCRTLSSAEVFDAFLGRTHVYAVPVEQPAGSDFGVIPPPQPEFGIFGVTPFDTLRFHVTNVTTSNTIPPPCSVQMGFINAAGNTVKTVNGTIAAGHTAFLGINFGEAGGALATNAASRVNLRPFVTFAPPCRVTASAELIDTFTGLTMLYAPPCVPGNIAALVATNTLGQ